MGMKEDEGSRQPAAGTDDDGLATGNREQATGDDDRPSLLPVACSLLPVVPLLPFPFYFSSSASAILAFSR